MRQWALAQRASVRIAFVLRLVSMGAASVLSLFWTRVLLRTMGDNAYGTFLSLQGVLRLAGLGDLGLSGAVAIRAGQALGRGDEEGLRRLLPTARSAMLLSGCAISGAFLLLSPWLPYWLGFQELPGVGSLRLLFAVGASLLLISFANGYFSSLNMANGTVTWPVLPALAFAQANLFVQWATARAGAPLWLQVLAAGTTALGALLCTAWMLRISHPWLGQLRPLGFDRPHLRELAHTSGWAYLGSIGSFIYTACDRLVINAGFGAATVPIYLQNMKLCELALQVLLTATAVSLPKIVRWIASPEADVRARLKWELHRLSIFQQVTGIAAAVVYLALNDWFITLWLGAGYRVPLPLQFAFALNLAVTVSIDVSMQTAGVCGKEGLRKIGVIILTTGLLNLGLSILAMKFGSLSGIAFATCLAQWIAGLWAGGLVAAHLDLPRAAWWARTCLAPVLAVAAACALRFHFPPDSAPHVAALVAGDAGLILLCAGLLGFRLEFIRHEWHSLRRLFAP